MTPEEIQSVSDYHDYYVNYYRDYYDIDFDSLIWSYYRLTPAVFDKQNYLSLLRHTYLENKFSAELAAYDMNTQQLAEYFGVDGPDNPVLRVKHILLSTEGMTEAEKAAALEKTYEIIDMLIAYQGDDTEGYFTELMSQFGEDPGMQTDDGAENGYTFGSNVMPEEFENAARKLDAYEFTIEPIETTFGYHIILRLPLNYELFTDEEWEIMGYSVFEGGFNDVISEYSDSLDELAGSAAFSITGGLEKLNLADIFDKTLTESQFLTN